MRPGGRYRRRVNSPPRPVTVLEKSDVLDGLFAVWADIDALAGGFGDEQWQARTALPGWNVHDVVAHIVGVESMLRGVATPEAEMDVSTLEHVRNDIGALNERWVRQLRTVSPDQLLELLRDVISNRRDVLTDIDDVAWNEITVTPAGPDTYGRFMRVRLFDCWMHAQDIRDAVGVPASGQFLAGPASTLTLDEITAAMGWVVGKLGAAPDGSRVRFELTGPMRRRIDLCVDGRARVVDGFGDDAPTAVLQLDGVLFTRLIGGRSFVGEHAGDIEYRGDQLVARRIAEHLNYVI